jgi:ketosteroid isomerase-like protein
MSQENIQAGIEFVGAVNRGDVEAAVRLCHPDVHFEPLRAATEGEFVGRDGIKRFLEDTLETFEVFKVQIEDVRDLGDRVLATGSIRIRGRGSGVETDIPTAALAQYSDGLMRKYKDYGDEGRALEAAGLTQ